MELYEIVNRYHIGTNYSCAESILLGCEEYYHLHLPEQGDVQALSCLAECYEAGCGVPCDLDRAIALYDQAAALGDGYAHEEASRLRLLRSNRRRKWDFESLQ